jgi:uncharacterized membrane protein YdjX (TVP38/TMEM64 family)
MGSSCYKYVDSPLPVILLGIITCLLVYGWKDVLVHLSEVSDHARERAHILDDVLFFCLILVVGLCAFPGMSMLQLTCGFILGFTESFIVSVVATIVVSCLAFALGRYFLQDLLRDYLEENDLSTVRKILRSVERQNGIFLQVLFRLMFVPLFVKNYGPSVINTTFLDFSIAVVVTTPIYVGIFTFLGSHAKTLADIATGKVSDDSFSGLGWMELLPLILSLVAGAAFTLLAYFEFRRITKEEAALLAEEQDRLVSS